MKTKKTSLETLVANRQDISSFQEWFVALDRIASLIVKEEQRIRAEKVRDRERAARWKRLTAPQQ